MKKTINQFWHSAYIGIICAIVVIICGLLGLKAWIAFFAWANYFLHGCDFKKSLKMVLAFVVGLLFAYGAGQVIDHYSQTLSASSLVYLSSGIIFIVATCLMLLERIENWGEMVPATFLGTVLYFSTGVTSQNFISVLVIPILIGILAGLLSIEGRKLISKLLR